MNEQCPTCGISRYWLDRCHPSNLEEIDYACPDDEFHTESRERRATEERQ